MTTLIIQSLNERLNARRKRTPQRLRSDVCDCRERAHLQKAARSRGCPNAAAAFASSLCVACTFAVQLLKFTVQPKNFTVQRSSFTVQRRNFTIRLPNLTIRGLGPKACIPRPVRILPFRALNLTRPGPTLHHCVMTYFNGLTTPI